MVSIYKSVWRHLATSADDEISSRDLSYLRRAYYQLLCNIAKNNLFQLWLCLGDGVDLEILLKSIVEGAVMVKEPTVTRILKRKKFRRLEYLTAKFRFKNCASTLSKNAWKRLRRMTVRSMPGSLPSFSLSTPYLHVSLLR